MIMLRKLKDEINEFHFKTLLNCFNDITIEKIKNYPDTWLLTDSRITENFIEKHQIRTLLQDNAVGDYFEIPYNGYNSDFVLTSKIDVLFLKLKVDIDVKQYKV